VLSILRLHYLQQVIQNESIEDLFVRLVPAISCAQLNIGYSILASIVPCMKNFMAAFEQPATTFDSYHMQSATQTKKRYLIKSTALQASEMSWACIGDVESTRPDSPTYPHAVVTKNRISANAKRAAYEATITGRPSLHGQRSGGRLSADDESDRRMIIFQGLEWSVDFHDGVARSPSPPECLAVSSNRMEEGRGLL